MNVGKLNQYRNVPGVGWRTPEKAAERHAMMVALRDQKNAKGQSMTLKAIAFVIGQEFGWPLDHSTIIHHLSGRCRCEMWAAKNSYGWRATKAMLRAIADFWDRKGYAPSIRDLLNATWYESTSAVKYQVDRCRRLGLVVYEPRTARSLKLTESGWKLAKKDAA